MAPFLFEHLFCDIFIFIQGKGIRAVPLRGILPDLFFNFQKISWFIDFMIQDITERHKTSKSWRLFFQQLLRFFGAYEGAIDHCNEVKFPAVPKGLQGYAPVSRQTDKNHGAVLAWNTIAVPT